MPSIKSLDQNYCTFLLRRIYELENQIAITAPENKKYDLLWSDYCHLWREIKKITEPFVLEVMK